MLLLFCANTMAADGDLDTSFGGDGIVTTDIGSDEDGQSVAIQSDGKIVVSGGSGGDFAVVRYNTDGSLDTSFGIGGIVTTDIDSNNDTSMAVAIQPDGKLVVAGSSSNGSNKNFAVVRYNTDGSLDTSFDDDGIVTTDFGDTDGSGWGLLFQSDGKILVTGEFFNSLDQDFAVVRYNTDGSLDTSFGSGGIVTTDFGNTDEGGWSSAIQDDGKILVAGSSTANTDTDFAIARYNTDGSLDTSFGSGGIVITDLGSDVDVCDDVTIQDDGKIVAAGVFDYNNDGHFAVVRYNTDGSLDTSFGTGGLVTTDIGTGDWAYYVGIQADGKIIVTGDSHNGSNSDFAVVRYNADGSLDTSFGQSGIVADSANSDESGYAGAIQADGKIVIAGSSYNGSNTDFALARYEATVIDNADHSNLINWNNNLVADFGDNGLWYHDGSSWNWMSNSGHVGQMVPWDNKLVVDFGADKGLWYYDITSWHWMTNNSNPNLMIPWNNGTTEKLVVDYGSGNRIYTYDGAWNWFSNKDGVNDMTVWNNKLIVDFGSGRGVYNYDTSWHWMTNKDDVNRMLPWDNGTTERLVVDFGSGRCMYIYDGSWNWFTNKDGVNDMTVCNQKLVVDFGGGRCLYNYDTSWHWMNNKDDVACMVTWRDAGTDLAVDFGSGRNMYTYNGAWTWIKNANNVPEMLAWNNRLVVDFGFGTGVYNYNGSWHQMKPWSTAD